jgi:hypothetical protein
MPGQAIERTVPRSRISFRVRTMEEILKIIGLFLLDIILGLISSIPGIMINSILCKKGIIRDQKTLIILGCIIGMIGIRFIAPLGPKWIAMILVAYVSPSAAFSNEFILYRKRGKWWWLIDKKIG